MKRAAFLLLIFLVTGQLYAQSFSNKSVPETLEFVPNTIINQHTSILALSSDFTITTPNRLLITSGWILQGLKYESIVDEFQSFEPFDARAFTPHTVSEFNSSLTSNYLIIHKD